MWKKSETEGYNSQTAPEPQMSNSLTHAATAPKVRAHATIGPTISINGDLTGEEDILIEGKIEGKIQCRRHSVTIGKNGNIRGDIYGGIITIEGKVDGNLYGEEQLNIRAAGTVNGNIVAPRVALEDGANFKGGIDMSPKEKSPAAPIQPASTPSIAIKTS